jgi:RNA polymerase sigma-70 factor (ECF subfamily)
MVTPSAEDLGVHRADLLAAWSALSESEREVLALAAWDGLPAAEAARVLGVRRTTYSVRLLRARRRLESLGDTAESSRLAPTCEAPAGADRPLTEGTHP